MILSKDCDGSIVRQAHSLPRTASILFCLSSGGLSNSAKKVCQSALVKWVFHALQLRQ